MRIVVAFVFASPMWMIRSDAVDASWLLYVIKPSKQNFVLLFVELIDTICF
jgi:hypothetical protein